MNRKLFLMVSLLVVASLALAACAPKTAAPTEAPTGAPTEAPTEAPFAAPVQTEGLEEAAFEPMIYPETPDCAYGGGIKSIEAVDELTVVITTCAPDPAVPAKVAFSSLAIQPREWLEFTGGTGDLLEKPIGTGPYYVAQWERGSQVVLKRFDGFRGEPAPHETLVFRWGAESAQRLLELQSGTVDAIDNVGPDDFATVEGDPTLQLVKRPALNIMYIGMTNTFPPFDNELVRQAFAQGIDRQRIIDNFYPAGSELASHFTPCVVPNGCEGDEWYAFDLDAAKALLEEAGYGPDNPFPEIPLYYRDVVRGYLPDPGIVAQDIQAQLKENFDITVNIEVMESGAFLDASNSGSLDGMHLLGWLADFPDVVNFLDAHFSATAYDQFGTSFPDITDNLASGAQEADVGLRAPFYEAANNAIKQHVPMIPVVHGGSAVAGKASLLGLHASPLNNEEFFVMDNGADTFVWMQSAEPLSLYCADETDGETFRVCIQLTDALLSYETGGTATETDGLAESFESNADATVWTFHLAPGVRYHNGFTVDAADIVVNYALQWDAAHPLHTGNTGAFEYWGYLFGSFLNAPPAAP